MVVSERVLLQGGLERKKRLSEFFSPLSSLSFSLSLSLSLSLSPPALVSFSLRFL